MAPIPNPPSRGGGSTAALGAGMAAVLLIASPFVAGWEGRRNEPYRDMARGIWTVCDGETNVPMRRYEDPECDVMLDASLLKHATAITPCLPPSVPIKTHAAFVSFAYNVGSRAFCSSTLSRKAKAGDLWGACAELSKWNKARVGGVLRVVRGLDNRRKAERSLCEAGLLR